MSSKEFLIKLITVFTVLLTWQVISNLNIINPSLLPSPITVAFSFIAMVKEGVLLYDMFWSLQRIFVAIIFAALFGVLFAIITAKISLANHSIGTIFDYVRATSPIALAPFVILWFGIGEFPKILIVFYLAAMIIWLNAHSGFKKVSKYYIWAAKSLGAKRYDLMRYIELPNAMPFIVNGIRVAIAISFISIVVAEMNGAVYGLGYHIFLYYQNFLVDKMLVNLITLTSLAYFSDKLFLFIIKQRFRWHFIEGENAQ